MADKIIITKAREECKKLLKSEKGYRGISSEEFWAEGYNKGFKEGRKDILDKLENAIIRTTDPQDSLKWHDLREDPNDLPKKNGQCLVAYRNFQNTEEIVTEPLEWNDSRFVDENYDNIPWFDHKGVLIAWCELPKFKE